MNKINNAELAYIQDNPIEIIYLINNIKNEIIPIIEKDLTSSEQSSFDSTIKIEDLSELTTFIDLTTLEGSDNSDRIISLVEKAVKPSFDTNLPSVAAVCMYGDLVKYAKKRLEEIGNEKVKIAAVSSAFPSGRASLNIKLLDTNEALEAGADEIDMVIDRGALLAKDYVKVFNEVAKIKKICGNKTLKVIIESGELKSNENIIIASFISMFAGADFIKTSTGKISIGATRVSVLSMLGAIKYFYLLTDKKIGIKPSGGIKNFINGIEYKKLVEDTLGSQWVNPDLFRLGASSMLDEIIIEYKKIKPTK
jgi:deoxyribose-phosphate aldolase